MAKIRHLAIKTKDPARLAKFYEEVFDLKVVHTEQSGTLYMTDGYFSLAIIRNRGQAAPCGINHFGFQIDDLDETRQRLESFNEPLAGRPDTRPYAENRAMDPDGNIFDISVHGFQQVEYERERDAKRKKKVEA